MPANTACSVASQQLRLPHPHLMRDQRRVDRASGRRSRCRLPPVTPKLTGRSRIAANLPPSRQPDQNIFSASECGARQAEYDAGDGRWPALYRLWLGPHAICRSHLEQHQCHVPYCQTALCNCVAGVGCKGVIVDSSGATRAIVGQRRRRRVRCGWERCGCAQQSQQQ